MQYACFNLLMASSLRLFFCYLFTFFLMVFSSSFTLDICMYRWFMKKRNGEIIDRNCSILMVCIVHVVFPMQLCLLDLVIKLLPEDSREAFTVRILLYKLFYDQTDQGMCQFILNLVRSFDTHKQPKRLASASVSSNSRILLSCSILQYLSMPLV